MALPRLAARLLVGRPRLALLGLTIVLPVRSLLLGGRRLLALSLLDQLSHQLQIVARVRMVGGLLQRRLIGVRGFLELPQTRQGIAPIVVGLGAVHAGECLQRLLEIARAVTRRGPPGWALEMLGRRLRLPGRELTRGLLIRPLPEVRPAEGVARIRWQNQRQG